MSETSLQLWSNQPDLTIPEREDTCWEVIYVNKKVYLTEEEKEFLLKQLKNGVKYVEIKGNVLTGAFMLITPNQELFKRIRARQEQDRIAWEQFLIRLPDWYPELWKRYNNKIISEEELKTLYGGGTYTITTGKQKGMLVELKSFAV